MMAVFQKGSRLRHVGHLDIMRTMQRALRRSGLPVSYSNGYSPHILVNFASPLSVGFSGENEVMEVALFENINAEEFLCRMNQALPEDLKLRRAKVIEQTAPSLMSQVQAAEYSISFHDDGNNAKCIENIENFMNQSQIPVMKKTKSGVREVDIKPWIFSLKAENGVISTVLSLTEKETCRPDMLLAALCQYSGVEPGRTAVTRINLLGRNQEGSLVKLEECF